MIKQFIITATIISLFGSSMAKIDVQYGDLPISKWQHMTVEQQDKCSLEYKSYVVGMTEAEFKMFSSVVEAESDRNKTAESYENRVLIGLVILNRVTSSKFPNTITKVIKQKGQFSVVSSGAYKRVGRTNLSDRAIIEAVYRKQLGNVPNILYFNCRGFFKGHKKFKKVGDNYFSY